MESKWDPWLSVAWRVVAIALIILEATKPKVEVSEARLVLYATMLGLPSVLRRNGGGRGDG